MTHETRSRHLTSLMAILVLGTLVGLTLTPGAVAATGPPGAAVSVMDPLAPGRTGAVAWQFPSGEWERQNPLRPLMPTPTPMPAPTLGPVSAGDVVAQIQAYSLQLHNRVRETHGIAPLVLDVNANMAALRHAQDMAQNRYFSHVGLDGSQPWDRMTRAGATWTTAGENIGMGSGYGASLEALTGLITSNFVAMMAETAPNDGHRRNILDEDYRRLGVGIATSADGSKSYWVCDFLN